MTKQTKIERAQPRVFISYAQEDQGVAAQVKRILAEAMQNSIIVGPAAQSGELLGSIARREFDESDLYVFLLTPHALDSDRARVELGAAWALKKPTLVVVSDVEHDLQVPIISGLEVARVSVGELERPGVVEDILHRIGRDGDRVT
jgi:TIR domain